MVMMPSVPEYSSITTARWIRLARMSASTSSAPRACGTNNGWRISARQSSGGSRAGHQEREYVLDVHHSLDFVERLAVHRHAAVAVLGERGNEFVPARAMADRDDLAAGDRNVVGIVLAEMEEVAQHLPLGRRQVTLGLVAAGALVLVLVDGFFELRAQRLIAVVPIEQPSNRPPQRAATVRLSACRIPVPALIGHSAA